MNNQGFDCSEFLSQKKQSVKEEDTFETENEENTAISDEIEENIEVIDKDIEIDVQKTVVEELAKEKQQLNIDLEEAKAKIDSLNSEISKLEDINKQLTSKLDELSHVKNEEIKEKEDQERKIAALEEKVKHLLSENQKLQMKEFDTQERKPNALALLDRDIDLPDRFPGETRDHVLEVIREAFEEAQKSGRIRRSQVLESILVANDPNGNLQAKREKILNSLKESNNILSGEVIELLKEMGISCKDGENYLMPSEIIYRNF